MKEMKNLKINKERLMEIAEKPSEEAILSRQKRKTDRYLILASTAIASKIARAMRVKNIKNIEMANILGVTPANITRYLSGKANFELKTLVEFENALGISLIDRRIPQ